MFNAGVRLGEGWCSRPRSQRPLSPIRAEDEAWWSTWAPRIPPTPTVEQAAAPVAAATTVKSEALESDSSEDETWGVWQAKSGKQGSDDCSVDWDEI